MAISHLEVVEVRIFKRIYSLRNQAHEYFDKLWQYKYLNRDEAYEKLAEHMGIPESKAHMRMMGTKQCREVVEWDLMLLNDMRRLDLDYGAPINHPYYEIIQF